MKALLYLVGLIGVGLAIAYFGYNLPPKAVWYKLTGGSAASEQSKDVSSTFGRMKEVAGDRFGEAKDKYDGKIEVDDPYAYPNARQ